MSRRCSVALQYGAHHSPKTTYWWLRMPLKSFPTSAIWSSLIALSGYFYTVYFISNHQPGEFINLLIIMNIIFYYSYIVRIPALGLIGSFVVFPCRWSHVSLLYWFRSRMMFRLGPSPADWFQWLDCGAEQSVWIWNDCWNYCPSSNCFWTTSRCLQRVKSSERGKSTCWRRWEGKSHDHTGILYVSD